MLPRNLYLPPAGEDASQWYSVSYVDGELSREELLKSSSESDAYLENQRRISPDNGRTWSALQSLEDEVVRELEGGGMVTYPCGGHFDRKLSILYQKRMRRLWPGRKPYDFEWETGGHAYNDHVFVVENGQVEKLLRYEDGPDFDPEDPFAPAFCSTNRAYLGQSIAVAADGTAFFPMICYRPGEEYNVRDGGVVLMRRDVATGAWSASNPQFVAAERSSRGLLEPDVAVLQNGHILVVCRGSNTASTPGRKWFAVSTDGGRTLSPVEEFRYSDGGGFYSPSSIHYFARSARNGILYWMANIVPEPPQGNGPRYPLYIAEIDEDDAAVKRESLLVVDDRGESEPEALQLSNFCILEDRETLDMEIYLTRLGENAAHFWQAGVYRYTFSPPPNR